jgi:nucleoside-triphosphatase THEP1
MPLLTLLFAVGVGKTTVLREVACILSANPSLNVVVVDKTCEIAGDGDSPHAAIGSARWMPVGKPNLQAAIMREAVENQSPDVVIVDEISTPAEVDAAKTIAQRGVQLIATVHGYTLPEIVNCKERGSLAGGIATVTLSGREAERRADKRKQVLKRSKEPIFTAALELHHRDEWIFHPNVKESVDNYFDGIPSEAVELHPGAALAVKSIPGEGCFEYCRDCGLGYTCGLHLGDGYASHHGQHHYTVGAPSSNAQQPQTHSPGKRRGGKGKKR